MGPLTAYPSQGDAKIRNFFLEALGGCEKISGRTWESLKIQKLGRANEVSQQLWKIDFVHFCLRYCPQESG